MSNGLKLKEWDIEISKHRYSTLINNFLKYVYGYSSKKEEIQEYSSEEYKMVLTKLTDPCCDTLSDMAATVDNLDDDERDILFSFFKLRAIDLLGEKQRISLKDELSNSIAFIAATSVL